MTRLKAADLFDGLDPEEKSNSRKLHPPKTGALESIIQGFDKILKKSEHIDQLDELTAYALRKVLSQEVHSADITAFILYIAQSGNYFDENETALPVYINALLTCCKEAKIHLPLTDLPDLSGLCANIKHKEIYLVGNPGFRFCDSFGGTVIVEGDASDDVGAWLAGGKIIVKGNADYNVGLYMQKGRIVIEGDAGDDLGKRMDGGLILVRGDVGKNVGDEMKGGRIYLHGKYESLGKPEGGKIYHKGTLIMKDGVKLT